MTQDLLSEKYAVNVLEKIYELTQESDYDEETRPILKKDLRGVVRSSSSLDKLLAKLEEYKYITLSERIKGRKTIAIGMTPLGLSMAQTISNATKRTKSTLNALTKNLEDKNKKGPDYRIVVDLYIDRHNKNTEKKGQQRILDFENIIKEWLKKDTDLEHSFSSYNKIKK